MPKSIGKIVNGYLNLTLSVVSKPPSYQKIVKIHLQLNTNTVLVRFNLRGGARVHLALSVSPVQYATTSATPFIAPRNSSPTPMITAGITDPQIHLYLTNTRGGSNSIVKYCNTIEILQYLLQYFEVLQ